MSWVTILWSMIASVSFTLAMIHFLIWCRELRSWANLCFFVMAVGVIGLTTSEMGAMYAETPAVYGMAVRWGHFAYGFVAVGSLGFVHFHFGTGRRWLLGTALGLRLLAVVVNFSTGLNLHIRAIHSLQQVNFLGEPVSMLGEWTPNPWVRLGQLAALAQVAYVVDASIRLWRTGAGESQRRAVIVGGTLAFFILFASAQAGLVVAGALRMPMVVSFPFLAVLLAMGYELSRDALRSSQLGRELRESEQRMSLATDAANLGVWVRDFTRNEIWASDKWRELFGFTASERLELPGILQKVHPEDRGSLGTTLASALEKGGSYETEYRIVLPDGRARYIASRGRVECNGGGKPILVRGVSLDVTRHKRAEQELHERRGELAHLSRVTMLGELSGSLAHELNQPLTAILANAQAAEFHLAMDAPDLTLVREILADIVTEDERAGDVIRRLRLLLKKGEVQQQALDANEVVADVLKLARGDLTSHGVTVVTELAPDLAAICCDGVQLQQVLLNFVMNACDAVDGNDADDRQLTVRTCAAGEAGVRIEVCDNGRGLPEGGVEQAFERYFTTKSKGLGLGLSVCRTIITAHGGTLGAANNPGRGATFYCALPLAKETHA